MDGTSERGQTSAARRRDARVPRRGPGVLLAAGLAALAGCGTLPPLTPFASPDEEPPRERMVMILTGVRDLESRSDYHDADEQKLGGLELSWWRPGEALAFEVAAQHSWDDDELEPSGKIKARVTDLSAGLRLLGGQIGPAHTYLGGGLAVLYGETETRGFGMPDADKEDWSVGTYLHAGAWGALGEELRLGFDARWLAEDWLSGGDLDMDHTQLVVTIGTGF